MPQQTFEDMRQSHPTEEKNNVFSEVTIKNIGIASPISHFQFKFKNPVIGSLPIQFYCLLSEFLDERLPMIVFTNKASFKLWFTYLVN